MQRITRGFLPGTLILSEGLFVGEGQDQIEILYTPLKESLANFSN